MSNGLGWDALFFSGSVADLDIRIYTARASAKAEDLGVKDTQAVRQAMSLGSLRLVQKSRFDAIQAIAREAKRTVEAHSLNFPFIRGARYIPAQKVESLVTKLRGHREAFNQAADDFAAEYADIRAEMEPVIRKALADACCDNPENSLNRILAEYPQDVRSKFSMTWNFYSIRGAKTAAAAEGLEQEQENVKGVIREMVTQLREEFKEKVEIITASVARGAKIKSNTASSAREVLSRVQEMNLFGDAELNRQVAALRRVLDAADENGRDRKDQFLGDLDTIRTSLDASLEEAVSNAESYLTGLGRRKFQVPEEVA